MRAPPLPALTLLLCTVALAAPAPALQTQDPYSGLTTGGWQLLGPLDNPDGNSPAGRSPLDAAIRDLAKLEPDESWEALGEQFPGKDDQPRGWRAAPAPEVAKDAPPRGPFDSGRIDLRAAGNGLGGTDLAASFLYLAVDSPDERVVRVHFGSDDGVRFWFNGEMLVDKAVGRGVNPMDETVDLALRAGRNHLLAKVCNGGGAYGFEMVQPRPVAQRDIEAAIDRGVELLIDRQLIDGSWQDWSYKYRNGQTALAVYTLVKCGVSAEHPAVLKALAFLRSSPTPKTYSVGCLLMALDTLGRPQDLEWMEELTGDLLSWQDSGGGWAYPEGTPDLSVTQYAVLGLRAAANSGIEIPYDVWEDALKFTLHCQQEAVKTEDGPEAAFHYHSGRPWTASMTTAGLSNLAIIREQIGKRLKPRDRKELLKGMEMGATWLGRRFEPKNTGASNWHRYYLYGLERAGALIPTREFGGRDWYVEGARALVRDQKDDGSWQEQHYDGKAWMQMRDTDTCFGLLFLRRATGVAVTQEDSSRAERYLFKSAPEDGPVELHVVNRATAVLSVRTIRDERADSAVEARFFVRRAGKDAWQMIDAKEAPRFATQHAFPLPGDWEAKIEVQLADGTTLASGVVAFEVEVGISPEQLAYATDALDDLLPLRRPRFEASTSAAGTTPALLADSAPYTGWRCAKDDGAPELSVELRGSTKVDRILFTHVHNRNGQGAFPRPTRIELWMDKDKEPLIIDIDPDPRVKTAVEFEKTRKIRRLRFRIVDVRDGTLGAAEVGFASLELIGPRR